MKLKRRYSAMRRGQGDASTAIDAEADDLVAADAGLTSMKTSLNPRRAILIYADGQPDAHQSRVQAGCSGAGEDQRQPRCHDERPAHQAPPSASSRSCARIWSAPPELRPA